MAMTFDELIGRDTKERQDERIAGFPTYDEFQKKRGIDEFNSTGNYSGDNSRGFQTERRNNRDAASFNEYNTNLFSDSTAAQLNDSYRRPTIVEEARRDLNSINGFGDTSFKIFDSRSSYNGNSYGNNTGFYGGSNGAASMGFADTRTLQDGAKTDLYSYTVADNDRLGDEELFEKLAHTNAGKKPVFDRTYNSSFEAAGNAVSNPETEKSQIKNTAKKRKRLNTKGKVVLVGYIAFIIAMAVLIIVNAGAINKGEAVTPSSSVSIVTEFAGR